MSMRLYFQRAFLDLWRNRFLTVITVVTIALSVLIASTSALFFINAGNALNLWKNEIRMMVYIKSGVKASDLQKTRRQLQEIDAVREAVFISSQEALERLKRQMPGNADLIDSLPENPLPDAFEIVIDPAFSTGSQLAEVAGRIGAMGSVDEVEYGQQWIQRIANVVYLFSLVGYAIAALFFLATTFIVANTIRLVLYSRREEMEIMRLVGATDWFIKTPFYLQGVMQGGLGAGVGLGVLYAVYHVLVTRYAPAMIGGLFTFDFLSPRLCAALVGGGVAVGWLGCFASLKQFIHRAVKPLPSGGGYKA